MKKKPKTLRKSSKRTVKKPSKRVEEKRQRKKECLEELTEIITKLPCQLNISSLAKKYKFRNLTIAEWRDEIIRNIKPEDVMNISLRMESLLNRCMKECEKVLISNPDPKTRMAAVKAANLTTKGFTDFLESWSKKVKVADKLDLNADINIPEIRIIMPEEEEEEKE